MKGIDVTSRIGDCCSEYFADVRLELVARKEFFIRWTKTGDSVLVQTSDYLEDAPDEVLAGIALTACRRLNREEAPVPQCFLDYVRGLDFIKAKQPLYIQRSRNLLRTEAGQHFNICDSLDRLLDSGLLMESDLEYAYFSWTKRDTKRKLGFCSTMFRVVGISSILDDPGIPDRVRDYVVYHECLHLRQRFRIPHNAHNAMFRKYEHMFPGWKDIEEQLTRL